MSVEVLGELQKLNDKFDSVGKGNPKSIRMIKSVIDLTTDKKSVDASASILNDIKILIKEKLPTYDEHLTPELLVSLTNQTIQNIKFVQSILGDVQHIIDSNGGMLIDDDNMVAFISNFQKTKECLLYVSDYLKLVAEVQKSKEQIKNGQLVEYTLDEVLANLKAA